MCQSSTFDVFVKGDPCKTQRDMIFSEYLLITLEPFSWYIIPAKANLGIIFQRTPKISHYSKKASAAKSLKHKEETETAETNGIKETNNEELQESTSAPDIESKQE